MLTDNKFRPWGDLDWVMKRYPSVKWYYLGCLATEERCLSAYDYLDDEGHLVKSIFYEIVDPHDTERHKHFREQNKIRLSARSVSDFEIEMHNLLESPSLIVSSINCRS